MSFKRLTTSIGRCIPISDIDIVETVLYLSEEGGQQSYPKSEVRITVVKHSSFA